MIIYLQFNRKYAFKLYNLIYNIMINELNISSDLFFELTKDLENINNSYFNQGGNFWIAIDTEKDEVVGSAAISIIDKNKAEFKRFYVKKAYRNRLIGYNLYKIAEHYAKNNKISELYLITGTKSKKAKSIYYRNGWVKVDEKYEKPKIFIREGTNLYVKKLDKVIQTMIS